MDKTKPIYIYQLDPNDHSRVVAWWDRIRDFHQFIDRIPSDWPEYEMYWCFSDDYENANGPTSDGRKVNMTWDQRFCVSKHYQGTICKYSLEGEFIEEMTIKEFRALGGHTTTVGKWAVPWGWPEFHQKMIQVRYPQIGYHWDFACYDKITVLMIPEHNISRVDPERLKMLATGKIVAYNPVITERAGEARQRGKKKKLELVAQGLAPAVRIRKPGAVIGGKIEYTCNHCGHTGKGPQMFRWHMENCKKQKK